MKVNDDDLDKRYGRIKARKQRNNVCTQKKI